jgi:hypothetical protein
MASSAPMVKAVIPKINRIVPTKNIAIESAGTGTKIKDSAKTIKAMGNTEVKDSFNFDFIFSFTLNSPYL